MHCGNSAEAMAPRRRCAVVRGMIARERDVIFGTLQEFGKARFFSTITDDEGLLRLPDQPEDCFQRELPCPWAFRWGCVFQGRGGA